MNLRVSSLCYATSQGLGHLMKSFYDAGLVTHPIIYRHGHPSRPTRPEWYPPGTPILEPKQKFSDNQEVLKTLGQTDVLLCFETFFDWSLVTYCRERGIKTALCVMHEWTPRVWPAKPDMVICPSLLDYDYFKDQFPSGRCVFLPIPVRTDLWRQRTVAKRYLHNAGNVGHREHKGTRQLLEAVKLLTKPIELTVRAQDTGAFHSIIGDVFGGAARALVGAGSLTRIDPKTGSGIRFGHDGPVLWLAGGNEPYESLWDGVDVYVAPEKFNGLSLPLQEARAAGLLVMTTDRYPANTWLPPEPLINPDRYQKACVGSSYYEFDEAVVRSEDIAADMDFWYGQDISAYSASGLEWAQANSWESLKPRWMEALTS